MESQLKRDENGSESAATETTTADEELTDPATVRELIERKENANAGSGGNETARVYECLDCGAVAEGLLGECPDCGASAFETITAEEGDRTTAALDPLVTAVAKLTGPSNPYVPR